VTGVTRLTNSILIILMIVAISLLGCGKKDDPLPPDVKIPESVKNLKVERMNFGARILWQMPESEPALKSVKIQKSELETLRKDCPECPRSYMVIGDYLINDPILMKEGTDLSYSDTNVKPGWLYTYRIIVCNQSGYCSDPSDPSEIKY
jgi:hypothetical protein